MKLSELTETQRGHLAWRLDHKTPCGLLTALRVARMENGDLDVAEVFEKYGSRSPRSAKIQATKCARFSPNAEVSDRRAHVSENTTGANGGSLH